ncbi:hypothetical protein [Bradyrhizobium sp. BR 1432]|uniref:hypothetical protein n=1 Tax=Bradyrhizobium sp. BR 1432 TaxID=3447966 RepID=UPI003EE7B50C
MSIGLSLIALIWMQNAYGLNATDVVLQNDAIQLRCLGLGVVLDACLKGQPWCWRLPGAHRDPDALVDLDYQRANHDGSLRAIHAWSALWMRRVLTAAHRWTSFMQRRGASAASVHQGSATLASDGPAQSVRSDRKPRSYVTAWSCPAEFDGAIVPIGRPIANTRVYLLDGHGAPVPFGAVGSSTLAGRGGARLSEPALS